LVDLSVETGIVIGVVDADGLLVDEHVAGDPLAVWDADSAAKIALGDDGIEFVGRWVVEEQRTSLGVEFHRGHLDQCLENIVEGIDRCQAARDIQQDFGLVQLSG
jgi:hypothetical protein